MANEPVVAKLKETLEAAARAFDSTASTAYDTFDWNVGELEALAREAFQAKLGHAYLIILNKLEKGEPLKAELQHFQQCTWDRSTPRTDGAEGLRVLRMLEGAEKSLKTR